MSKEFPAYSVDRYVRETSEIPEITADTENYQLLGQRLTKIETRWLWIPVLIFVLTYLTCYLLQIPYGTERHAKILYLLFVSFNLAAALVAINSWHNIPSRSMAKDSMFMFTLSLCSAAAGNIFDTIFWLTGISAFKQYMFGNLFFILALLFAMPGVYLLGRVCRVKFDGTPLLYSLGLAVVFLIIPLAINPSILTDMSELLNVKEVVFAIAYAVCLGYLAGLSLHLWRLAQGRLQHPARLTGIGLILLSFGSAIYAGLFTDTPAIAIPSNPIHIIVAMGYIISSMAIRRTEIIIRIIFNLKDNRFPASLPLIEIFGPNQGQEVYQKMETRIKEAFEELLRAKAETEVKQKIISELENEVRLRKETEQALIIEKEKAEEANETKSQFLAMMSHELKTPLTAIRGYGQLLHSPPEQNKYLPEPMIRELASHIVFNAGHLQTMIDGILRFSQLESGKFVYHQEFFKLNELVEYLQALIEQQKQYSQAKIELNAPQPDLSIYSDKLSLQYIMVNLLMNAIKFCKQGEISVDIEQDDHRLLFTVKDSGVGIAEQHQAKIFEAFYQISHGHRRKFGGTGLGLSIVKKLTEELGGEINLVSKEGQGSTFSVMLPNIIRGNKDEQKNKTG